MARLTGDLPSFMRALQMAHFETKHICLLTNVPDRPMSLFEGLGGYVSLARDFAWLGLARFPGYELV